MVQAIKWQDAAYSYDKNVPPAMPEPNITIGLVVSKNPDFVIIANDVHYNKKLEKIAVVEGCLIPRKTIISISNIGMVEL